MNQNNGYILNEHEHIKQSVRDILTTPIGSRLMLPDYGSKVFELIDNPITPALSLQISSLCVSALGKWESRVEVIRCVAEFEAKGYITLNLDLRVKKTAEVIDLNDIIIFNRYEASKFY